jgi:PRC-barrel domain
MAFKYLLAGVAAVALMAPPALAQDAQPQPQAEQGPPGTGTASDRPSDTEQQGWVSIGEVLGAPVVNENGDEVGEIHDVVMKDKAYYAVLSVGGFLGLGDKDVAVPLDELKLGEDEAYLMSAQTEEQLEQMPAYEATQYEPAPR